MTFYVTSRNNVSKQFDSIKDLPEKDLLPEQDRYRGRESKQDVSQGAGRELAGELLYGKVTNLGILLGQGGYARVWLGTLASSTESRLCAIKVNSFWNIAKREASILSKIHSLKNKNIVEFFGTMEKKESVPLLVFRFYPSDLRGWLKNDHFFDPKTFHYVFLGVANAVKYIHKKGVIHCDLRMENIAMTEYRDPVVIDFGLAVDKDSLEKRGPPVMHYRPPEAFTTPHYYQDMKADNFAVGMIFAILANGHYLFSASQEEHEKEMEFYLYTRLYSKKIQKICNTLSKAFTVKNKSEQRCCKSMMKVVCQLLARDPKERLDMETAYRRIEKSWEDPRLESPYFKSNRNIEVKRGEGSSSKGDH